MLNYYNYTYRDKPSSITKSFEVHPLAHKGHEEYISKDSEVHYYLHKLTPKIMEEIYKKKTVQQPLLNEERVDEEFPRIFTEEIREVPKKIIDKHVEINVQQPYVITESEFSKKKHNFSATFSKGFALRNNKANDKIDISKLCKVKRIPDENRYNNQYLKDVEVLKKTRYASTSHGFYRPKRYDGFESFNVPRVNLKEKDEFKSTKIYEDKITKTVYSGNDIQLDNENERLKNILKNQTNRCYLRTANLPHIETIIDQPKFLLKRTGTGSKNMGVKYNPFNFDPKEKNRTKRNPNGALFQF
jgi:hypothetical protein